VRPGWNLISGLHCRSHGLAGAGVNHYGGSMKALQGIEGQLE